MILYFLSGRVKDITILEDITFKVNRVIVIFGTLIIGIIIGWIGYYTREKNN